MRSILEANVNLKEAKEKIKSDTQARYKRQVKVRFAPGSLGALRYQLDIIHKIGNATTIGIDYYEVEEKNSIVWISNIAVFCKDYLEYTITW